MYILPRHMFILDTTALMHKCHAGLWPTLELATLVCGHGFGIARGRADPEQGCVVLDGCSGAFDHGHGGRYTSCSPLGALEAWILRGGAVW
jgi:hypothetical protein